MIEVPFPELTDDDCDLSGWLAEFMPNSILNEIPRWQILLNTEWNDWTVTIQFANEKDTVMFALRWL